MEDGVRIELLGEKDRIWEQQGAVERETIRKREYIPTMKSGHQTSILDLYTLSGQIMKICQGEPSRRRSILDTTGLKPLTPRLGMGCLDSHGG
jgi:hypothetical protein